MRNGIVVAVLAGVGLIVVVTGVGFLMAYPTKWLINYLFTSAVLGYTFGVAKISVWQAWALNCLGGILFKSTSTNSSK